MAVSVDVRWNRSVEDRMRRAVEQGTGGAWEDLLESANRNAPWLTGALVRTSRVVEVEDGRYRIEYPVPYAARQHWDQRIRHRTGRSRWLWTEIEGAQIERMIAARTRGF